MKGLNRHGYCSTGKEKEQALFAHTVSTKEGAVKLYRQTRDIDFVLRRYHISKASLMRWNKQYDGTKESLMPKSHRPHSQHPNTHSQYQYLLCQRISLQLSIQKRKISAQQTNTINYIQDDSSSKCNDLPRFASEKWRYHIYNCFTTMKLQKIV